VQLPEDDTVASRYIYLTPLGVRPCGCYCTVWAATAPDSGLVAIYGNTTQPGFSLAGTRYHTHGCPELL